MANNLWSNYTEKTATPVDTDEVMVRDSTDGKNKRLLFGTFWKWVAKKLNEATISELETDNKTIIGAINALNGKSLHFGFPNKTDSFYSSEKGVYFLSTSDYEKFSDKPNGFTGRSVWLYSHYNSNERVGILACSGNGKFAIGYCYGGNSLSWNIIK